jgi:hypothetical protein
MSTSTSDDAGQVSSSYMQFDEGSSPVVLTSAAYACRASRARRSKA